MSRIIVNQTVTADGYAAGPDQTEERPFGADGGDGWGNRLHAWMLDHADENRAEIEQMSGASAHIMGRNMFGPIRGKWDRPWNGWWGAAGLVDELRLHIVPYTLGTGVRVFDGVPPLNLEQVSARAASTVLHVTYRVAQ